MLRTILQFVLAEPVFPAPLLSKPLQRIQEHDLRRFPFRPRRYLTSVACNKKEAFQPSRAPERMQDGGSQQLDFFELLNSGSVDWQIHHTRFGCKPSVNLTRHCDAHEFRLGDNEMMEQRRRQQSRDLGKPPISSHKKKNQLSPWRNG